MAMMVVAYHMSSQEGHLVAVESRARAHMHPFPYSTRSTHATSPPTAKP